LKVSKESVLKGDLVESIKSWVEKNTDAVSRLVLAAFHPIHEREMFRKEVALITMDEGMNVVSNLTRIEIESLPKETQQSIRKELYMQEGRVAKDIVVAASLFKKGATFLLHTWSLPSADLRYHALACAENIDHIIKQLNDR
jgi:hypothetical protein